MRIRASVLYATRMLLSPSQKKVSGSGSSASRSLLGAILCIALSLVPLVVVLTVSDGMIEGITSRIVELSSYHMQVTGTGSSISTDLQDENDSFQPDLETAQGISDLALELQQVISDTDLSVCFDVGHANTTGQIDEMIETFGDRIVNVHIHDNNGERDQHLTIGDGNIDYVDVFSKLSSYQGNFVIEARDLESAIESQDRIAEMLE